MAIKKKVKYAAICIGINDYENWPILQNAVHDASAVADVFKELDYDVYRLMNIEATNKGYADVLCDIIDKHNRKTYDAVILYFAGHGFMTNLSDCLVLRDTIMLMANNSLIVKKYSINVQDFISSLRSELVPSIIVIIDACRHDCSNYATSTRGMLSLTAPGVGSVNTTSQTLIAYSTSANTGASDAGGTDGHSKYTSALLGEIKKALPIETIFKNVRAKVHQKEGDQMPWEYTSLKTDFYFNYGQLDPYYDAEYSKEAFVRKNYIGSNDIAKMIFEEISKETPYNLAIAMDSLKKNKSLLSEDDLFVIGRMLSSESVKYQYVEYQFLNMYTLRIFGSDVNHVLRGVYYEIYFDEEDNARTKLLGGADYLTIIDRLQSLLKNEDAAKFIKKQIESKEVHPLYELWNSSSIVNVDVVSEEMYCTDVHNNVIYGIRSILVNGRNILPELREETIGVTDKNALRRRITESISIPMQRLRLKGLEHNPLEERKYILLFIDNIEYELRESINQNLPDDISLISLHSYVEDLSDISISDVWFEGDDAYVEGSCELSIYNELDHEEMPNSFLSCRFKVKLYYDEQSDTYKIDDNPHYDVEEKNNYESY